jgi:lysophospholipase L1-like esterase
MNRFKNLLAMFGFYLLVLAGGEAALRGIFALRDFASSESVHDEPRAHLAAYAGADFDPVELWEEVRTGTDLWLGYQPYTVWTRKPIQGRHINVDEGGYRATVHNSAAPDAIEIWMIGGSTTWGMGVPDQHTIPSLLARQFGEQGIDVRIRNLGQTGFVSTQEFLSLMRELQKREPPDLFIVYDGLNEGIGLTERPDLINPHYLMGRVSRLFEGTESGPRKGGSPHPLMAMARTTAYYRLAQALRSRLPRDLWQAGPAKNEFVNDSDITAVAERSADILLENYRLMTVLGAEFGFPCFFFFQPQPGVSPKPLHESEEQLLSGVENNPEQHWLMRFGIEQRRAFGERLAAGISLERVFDISGMFDEVEQPLYLDWGHISHNGNELVAARIGRTVREAVCGEREVYSERLTEALAPACASGPGGGDVVR